MSRDNDELFDHGVPFPLGIPHWFQDDSVLDAVLMMQISAAHLNVHIAIARWTMHHMTDRWITEVKEINDNKLASLILILARLCHAHLEAFDSVCALEPEMREHGAVEKAGEMLQEGLEILEHIQDLVQ